ncbi:MAG: hypothetical protein ACK528_03525, partial [Alphaproteobacteria bacterium]
MVAVQRLAITAPTPPAAARVAELAAPPAMTVAAAAAPALHFHRYAIRCPAPAPRRRSGPVARPRGVQPVSLHARIPVPAARSRRSRSAGGVSDGLRTVRAMARSVLSGHLRSRSLPAEIARCVCNPGEDRTK